MKTAKTKKINRSIALAILVVFTALVAPCASFAGDGARAAIHGGAITAAVENNADGRQSASGAHPAYTQAEKDNPYTADLFGNHMLLFSAGTLLCVLMMAVSVFSLRCLLSDVNKE